MTTLSNLTPEQIAEVHRLAEEYVRKRFREIAAIGGRATTEKKRKAVRENAKKALAARLKRQAPNAENLG